MGGSTRGGRSASSPTYIQYLFCFFLCCLFFLLTLRFLLFLWFLLPLFLEDDTAAAADTKEEEEKDIVDECLVSDEGDYPKTVLERDANPM